MSKLHGKVAVVTGGASGIGHAIVDEFVREGAAVAIVDFDADRGSAAAESISKSGGNATFFSADLSREHEVESVIKQVIERLGGVHIAVSSAGVAKLEPTDTLSLSGWHKTMQVNLDGTFLVARECIKWMTLNGGGSIVNIASIHGHVGFPNHAAYTASKGAVVNLTRTLAVEFGKSGVRVNAVCPGVILTPLVQNAATPELLAELTNMHPIGRLGRVEEVAKAVLFLASEDSSFVTGSSLFVDGGYTAQ
ncbi:SDR family NAD(P)-dependent oxidoreductase [Sphingobium chungbukense]|uniref:Short-chain dehydrogenase n=1 Tax=Sphingobium chungbukense TaxID=56193 RepID=A0A0M3AJT5_9SPHN|nr:SDR family NAD(P)-dependent oxidoreductase [Sphingobium chungbukense]KKW90125.1 hypothetical protein YP76_22050 [Sphingobium chungbukense]